MFITKKEFTRLTDAIKKIEIADLRYDYFSCLGVDTTKIEIIHWANDTLEDLKESILNDKDFLIHLLNIANTNSIIQLDKDYSLSLELVYDLEDFSCEKTMCGIEVIFYQNDEMWSERFNYIWSY